MTKDTSVCEHQCVDNRNLSPVCRLLIAAAVRYEEDYNKKRLQGTSIRGHEEKAQDVEKKTQLVTVTDDEENISQGQHSALTLPPVAPSQEPSSMAPPQGSSAAEPAKENTTAVPVKGNGATKQQEENNEAPSEESSSTLAPQKSATVAPSNENSSTAPPHGISTAVPAKENIAAEPPKPNSAMEPPEVIVTAVPSNGSSSGALPQENNSTSPQEIDIAGLPQANSTATSTEENPATMSPQRNTTAELSEGEGKPTPSAGAVESSSAETERFQTVSSSSTKIYDSVAGQGETGRNETGQNETGQDKTTSVEIQSPLPSGSSAVEQESDFTIDTEYEKETTSSGSFMAYFITAVVLCVAGYVVYHNRQKILAFIMEGRQEQHRRRSATGGGSTAKYSKLHSSAEEAMPSLDKSVTSRNYIY